MPYVGVGVETPYLEVGVGVLEGIDVDVGKRVGVKVGLGIDPPILGVGVLVGVI